MLEFLSPLSLIGLFAAAIPLVIHLSRSRKVKTMRFSTTRFLTDQFLRSYRMSRLKEIGLLAARMALFALFAMALAQPLFLPEGSAVRSGGSRAVVFVLDDSASMSYVEDIVPLFDKARTGARAILDGLKSGDSASVVLASRRATGPEVVFPQLTTELADVRQVMDSLTVRELGTDLVQAVVRAEQLLQASRADSKEVYVFSDLQEFGFDPPESTAGISNVADILHFFVSVRPKEPTNVGLTALQFTSTRPMVGVPFALRPHVRCQGSDITACDLELFIDGQKMGEQHLDGLQSDRWSVGRFFPTFDKGGWHHGYIQVKDDRFPADNRRYFAFDVLDSVNVLAVNGASSSVPRLDELLFLKLALSAGAASGTPFHIDITTPTALSDEQLRDKALVILANVSTLTAPIVERLEAFVDRGGGLLIFVGDQVDATFYNQSLAGEARLHGGLLPGRLDVGHVSKVPASKSEHVGNVLYEGISDVDTNHPALSAFADEQGGLFAGVQFQSVWHVDPNNSAVLMRTGNGAPLLLEKSFGQGRVMLFASTCDRDWTNFPIRPAFLPWVYRVVGYLCQQRLARQNYFATGESVPVSVSAVEGLPQLLVKRPNGTLANLTFDNGSTEMSFAETNQAGPYALMSPGQRDPTEIFVANLEAFESDLQYVGQVSNLSEVPSAPTTEQIEAELKTRLPGRPLLRYLDNLANVADVSLTARRGVRFWDVLLWIALLVAIVEPWFANRISLERYLKTNEAVVTANLRSPRQSRFATTLTEEIRTG